MLRRATSSTARFFRLLHVCIGASCRESDWIPYENRSWVEIEVFHPDEEMAVRHESGCGFGVENRMMQNTLVFTLPPSVRRFRGVFLRRDAQTVVFEFKIRVVKRRI